MLDASESGATAALRDHAALSRFWWLWLPVAVVLTLLAWPQAFPVSYRTWVGGEQGALELLHVLIPLASLMLAGRLLVLARVRRQPLLWVWLALATLGSLYIAGEEASWGQNYLGWGTPEGWQALNDQNETNLHNTSSWFDQKPRVLLELGVIVGGIVIPLAALRWPAIRRARLAIILPPFLCLPSAVIAEVVRMSERALSALAPGTTLFERASEVQELYFYLFILLYLIELRRRLIPRTADNGP
ncbi:MAG: hypothetical protein ACTSQ7_06455 [Alphaproteobacteria bacterium]